MKGILAAVLLCACPSVAELPTACSGAGECLQDEVCAAGACCNPGACYEAAQVCGAEGCAALSCAGASAVCGCTDRPEADGPVLWGLQQVDASADPNELCDRSGCLDGEKTRCAFSASYFDPQGDVPQDDLAFAAKLRVALNGDPRTPAGIGTGAVDARGPGFVRFSLCVDRDSGEQAVAAYLPDAQDHGSNVLCGPVTAR